ncbi:hypothetical protein Tsubulata_051364 [Turnera subulata]|uniref:Uncharacterized protein n=1 Tax=Turnera subulata TaxID=218843 RepID=A0A9Q0J7H5_9ROSI|nr:hypothetical protein Tsubulata_051364 [Turnera subulata]
MIIWECGFCKHQFAQGTSATGITLHFSEVEVEGDGIGGILTCKKVPPDVQEKAYRAIGGSNKRRKVLPESCSGEGRSISLEANNGEPETSTRPELGQGRNIFRKEIGNGGEDMIEEELSAYYLAAGDNDDFVSQFKYRKQMLFPKCNDDEEIAFIELPEDIEELNILEWHDISSVCDAFPSIVRATSLKAISVRNCDAMQCLLSLSRSGYDALRSLEELRLCKMPFSLPSFENGRPTAPLSFKRITVSPKEWWDAVQWDHPNAKDKINSGWYIQIRTMCRITTET